MSYSGLRLDVRRFILLIISCCFWFMFCAGCGTAFDFHKTTDYLFLVGMFFSLYSFYRPFSKAHGSLNMYTLHLVVLNTSLSPATRSKRF